jgi:peroxiredoxin Q/BCP
MLQPGDIAPPFALSDQHGNTVSLADFAGRRVMVFWYPKASTPG